MVSVIQRCVLHTTFRCSRICCRRRLLTYGVFDCVFGFDLHEWSCCQPPIPHSKDRRWVIRNTLRLIHSCLFHKCTTFLLHYLSLTEPTIGPLHHLPADVFAPLVSLRELRIAAQGRLVPSLFDRDWSANLLRLQTLCVGLVRRECVTGSAQKEGTGSDLVCRVG